MEALYGFDRAVHNERNRQLALSSALNLHKFIDSDLQDLLEFQSQIIHQHTKFNSYHSLQ